MPDFESGAFDHSAIFPVKLDSNQVPIREQFKPPE